MSRHTGTTDEDGDSMPYRSMNGTVVAATLSVLLWAFILGSA